MSTTSEKEKKDKAKDDNWPVGFDKDGEPNIVGYIADWDEFLRTAKKKPQKKRTG